MRVALRRIVIDVSETLRAERQRAGLTLEEISSRTKIKVAFLQAIERGEFERLPGTFFVRAFLRTYAREVHLSPDEVVGAYDAQVAPVVEASPVGQSAPAPPAVIRPEPSPLRAIPLPSLGSLWPTIALGAAVVTVVTMMTRTTGDIPAEQVIGTSGVVEAATPAATAPPEAAAPQKLTIDIRPSRVLWVAGMADGTRVIYRLVEAGEHVRIDAKDDLWFRVGDAGAFVYSVNGSPEKPLGSPGEVREFRITHENLHSLER